MNRILMLLLFAAVASTCKKENVTSKADFVNIEFKIYTLRAANDTIETGVDDSSTVVLKSDYTWTADLGGAKSYGTYTLTPKINQQGEIKFIIVQWTNLNSNQMLSDKLKLVLQSVNYYGYSTVTTTPFLVLNTYDLSYYLRLTGK